LIMNFALRTNSTIDLNELTHTTEPLPEPSHSGSNQTSTQPARLASNCIGGGRDLHLVDLTVSYSLGSSTVTPIEGFSMFAPCGRVTALVGRSGTGKTSLLSCASATLRPASGKVWLGGAEVSSLEGAALDTYRRQSVGVVHQQYNLIPSLSAVENVVVPMSLVGVKRKEATERADELLKRFGMGAYRSHKPGQLSGGQQQRVAVARALANDPALIVADEPTAHLDGVSVADVRDLLQQIASEGRTVLLSTHDDRLLAAADQVITLGHED
jgi:putative ABC transport system ATP-binding protein